MSQEIPSYSADSLPFLTYIQNVLGRHNTIKSSTPLTGNSMRREYRVTPKTPVWTAKSQCILSDMQTISGHHPEHILFTLEDGTEFKTKYVKGGFVKLNSVPRYVASGDDKDYREFMCNISYSVEP